MMYKSQFRKIDTYDWSHITILDKGCDTDGRITHIKTIVENRNIVFLSVYAPCTPDSTLSVLSTYLLKFSDFEIVSVQIWIL